MKLEHTEGCWQVIPEPRHGTVHYTIISGGQPEIGQILREGDAYLCAASREMYEALEFVREICAGERGPQDFERDPLQTIHERIVPAIMKAEDYR